jgi:hypothetical protein
MFLKINTSMFGIRFIIIAGAQTFHTLPDINNYASVFVYMASVNTFQNVA